MTTKKQDSKKNVTFHDFVLATTALPLPAPPPPAQRLQRTHDSRSNLTCGSGGGGSPSALKSFGLGSASPAVQQEEEGEQEPTSNKIPAAPPRDGATTTPNWHSIPFEQKIEMLKKYKQRNGHARIPVLYVDPHTNFQLGNWVHHLRSRRHKLDNKRKEELDQLGFVWTAPRGGGSGLKSFEEKLQVLERFKERHGHVQVSRSYIDPDSGFFLGKWVSNMRYAKDMKITAHQRAQLDSMGFVWRVKMPDLPSMAPFELKFAALERYKSEHGNLHVPNSYVDPQTGIKLGVWVKSLRTRTNLSEGHRKLLTDLGFPWRVRQQKEAAAFASWISLLKKFKDANGHTFVSHSYLDPDTGARLGRFVHRQLFLKRRGMLPAEREDELNMLGFVWDSASFAKISNKQTTSSSTKSNTNEEDEDERPGGGSDDDDSNGDVTNSGNGDAINSNHHHDGKQKDGSGLNSGSPPVAADRPFWKLQARDKTRPFEQWVDLLREYKQVHGHLLVPQSFMDPSGASIGRFVHRQRYLRKRKLLKTEREEELNAIGFAWNGTASKTTPIAVLSKHETVTQKPTTNGGGADHDAEERHHSSSRGHKRSYDDFHEEDKYQSSMESAGPPPPPSSSYAPNTTVLSSPRHQEDTTGTSSSEDCDICRDDPRQYLNQCPSHHPSNSPQKQRLSLLQFKNHYWVEDDPDEDEESIVLGSSNSSCMDSSSTCNQHCEVTDSSSTTASSPCADASYAVVSKAASRCPGHRTSDEGDSPSDEDGDHHDEDEQNISRDDSHAGKKQESHDANDDARSSIEPNCAKEQEASKKKTPEDELPGKDYHHSNHDCCQNDHDVRQERQQDQTSNDQKSTADVTFSRPQRKQRRVEPARRHEQKTKEPVFTTKVSPTGQVWKNVVAVSWNCCLQ